jgi:hypothetical protein
VCWWCCCARRRGGRTRGYSGRRYRALPQGLGRSLCLACPLPLPSCSLRAALCLTHNMSARSHHWPHVCGLGKVSELCSNVMLECDARMCRRRRGAKDDRTRKDDRTVMLCRQDGPCRQDPCRALGRAHSCLESGHVKAYRGPASKAASKHPPPLAQHPPPSSAVPARERAVAPPGRYTAGA